MKHIPRMAIMGLVAVLCVICLAACGRSEAGHSQTFSQQTLNDTGTKPQDTPAQPQQDTPEPTQPPEEAPAESTTAPASDQGAAVGTVVIDAGHQSHGNSSQEPVGPGASETKAKVSDGTAGVSTGVRESVVNLEVALKLQEELEARGIDVIMVRDTEDIDISNSERAAIANDNHADLFIRLHCDGVEGSSATNGFYTLIPGENSWTAPIVAESAVAGRIIHETVLAQTGANDRGIKERTDLSGFNWCTVPTVLLEMGCMSNPTEDEKLNSDEYQRQLAVAIADGTVAYLNQR